MSAVPSARHSEPSSAGALSGTWTVVPGASAARFSVRDKMVATVHGTLPVEDGRIVVSDAGEVVEAWVTVSVPGIATGNRRRDRDLLKPGLLSAERFPTVRISVAGSVTSTPEGWTADGTVAARGAQAPVALTAVPVEVSATEGRVHVTGTLDRRPLGIKAPSFVIGRHVHLDAELVLRRTDG
jgi:polyisoprenoid-binding protein YceI